MNQQDKMDLIVSAASRVHEAWMDGEISNFYSRFLQVKQELMEQNPSMSEASAIRTAMQQACYKGGQRRNKIAIDYTEASAHNPDSYIINMFSSKESFKNSLGEVYQLQRFVKRKLTPEEISEMGANYDPSTQEENILRPFIYLSEASRAENTAAAIGAAWVYEQMMKRGATLDQLRSDELRTGIGMLIHADWMERNQKTDSNAYLFVPYSQLGGYEKQQDLDVFYALLDEVEANPEKYAVEPMQGLEPLSPSSIEHRALGSKTPSKGDEKTGV